MSKIARPELSSHSRDRKGLEAKLWPNGEISIWKPKTFKPKPLVKGKDRHRTDVRMARLRLRLTDSSLEGALASILGLSPLSIFDIRKGPHSIVPFQRSVIRAIKGQKGITSYGSRMVRNAAHVLEKSVSQGRCIFATVTCPPMPVEQMGMIHENWNQVVEYYRLGIVRALKKHGLSGELVTVSEIQEKRYQATGLPVLHLHSVFVGVGAAGKFAISTKQHDSIWERAIRAVIPSGVFDVSTACNLQRVKKSAAAYLGKYLSKGVKCIEAVVAAGFGGWMPKHWWSISRSLRHKVKAQTRRVDDFADWLDEVAEVDGQNVWIWHRKVILEMKDGQQVSIARYGRLEEHYASKIRDCFDLDFDCT